VTGVDRVAVEARPDAHREVANPWWTESMTSTDRFGPTECEKCVQPWPCDTALAVAGVSRLRQQLREAQQDRNEWHAECLDWQGRFAAATDLGEREKAYREDAEAERDAVRQQLDAVRAERDKHVPCPESEFAFECDECGYPWIKGRGCAARQALDAALASAVVPEQEGSS